MSWRLGLNGLTNMIDNLDKWYCSLRENITDKVKQEENPTQSEQRFKAVQEGFCLIRNTRRQQVITFIQPYSTSGTWDFPEEFMGRNAFDFIHPMIRTNLGQFQKLAESE